MEPWLSPQERRRRRWLANQITPVPVTSRPEPTPQSPALPEEDPES